MASSPQPQLYVNANISTGVMAGMGIFRVRDTNGLRSGHGVGVLFGLEENTGRIAYG